MDAQLKAKWVEALRSGKYEQAQRCLREAPYGKEPERFCCLGVLATIQNAEWQDETPLLNGYRISHDEGAWLEERAAGGLSLHSQKELARMNDSDVPFERIADHIEKNL